MTTPAADARSPGRRARDKQIAAEPLLPPLDLPASATPLPMEAHLIRSRRPRAVPGVVENGLVRPVDPAVKLPEHARVTIVVSERV
jgi:hypothetical protein